MGNPRVRKPHGICWIWRLWGDFGNDTRIPLKHSIWFPSESWWRFATSSTINLFLGERHSAGTRDDIQKLIKSEELESFLYFRFQSKGGPGTLGFHYSVMCFCDFAKYQKGIGATMFRSIQESKWIYLIKPIGFLSFWVISEELTLECIRSY